MAHIVQTFTSCLMLCQLLVPFAASQHPYLFFEETYQPENNIIKLKNMVLDPSTSALYVGSVNRLYKLSQDLVIEATIATGPRQDNPACIAPPIACASERITTDNINKLLVIDQDRLFVCGSIYQGSCVIRRLVDLGLLGNNSYEEIAANTADGTSVAFIAPGPYNQNVLYIATSIADWIDKAVPTMSSRVLPTESSGTDTLFEILKDENDFKKLAINIPTEANPRPFFNIYYIYGFSNTNFSYFVAVQPKVHTAIKGPYYTKIAQICQQDRDYYSYIELPLACKKGEKDYNVAQSATVATIGSRLAATNGFQVGERVLIVTFSESVENQLEPVEASAVCMYSIKNINQHYVNRRKECAQGITPTTDASWLRSSDCAKKPLSDLVEQIDRAGTEYCHKSDQFNPLGGKIPIEAQAIYTDNSILSAIAATAHHEETVIFLGDHHGHLKKLRVVSDSTAELYEDEAILVDQKPVVQNGITFSQDKNFIYFMTVRKIHKIPVENCSQYTTCESCLGVGNGTGDPYCGWCSLQKSCTRRNETSCTGSEDMTNLRWLGKLDQCIAILSVDPPNTPRHRTQELTLTTRGLPKLDVGSAFFYQCKFGGFANASATVETMNDTSKVQCVTPSSDVLPPIGSGFLRVKLAIHSTETTLDIVSTQFDFYDCGAFTSCMHCIDNKYKCDWCIFENKCVGNSTSCDANGIITKKEDTHSGELLCPRIVNDSVDILLAADVRSGFLVSAANLPIPKDGEAGYKCVLQYEDRNEEVRADRVSESSLQCNPRTYDYSANVNNLPVSLTVVWNKNFEIDNPDNLIVNLYKCDVKRPNCGICLAGNDKYQCGWCSTGVCSLQTQCGANWLNGDALCTDASITKFEPMSGYIKGDTKLTITGINLGLRVENIVNVTVAGIECSVQQRDYVIATQVICYTRQTEKADQGPIKVVIRGGNGTDTVTAESTTDFRYVIPKLTGVEPKLGPLSGGTNITIAGQNLDAGKKVITVIKGLPCQQISRSSNELFCTTPAGLMIGNSSVAMAFDDKALEVYTVQFEYATDPVIISLNRFDSIKSGGLMIEVSGNNLDVIQSPKIQFTVGGTKLTQECNPPKPKTMVCPTPDIGPFMAADYAHQSKPDTKQRRFVRETGQDGIFTLTQSQFGFILDGVKNFTSLDGIAGIQAFKFYPDPVYFEFQEENHIRKMKFDQNNILEIAGQNLTPAYKEGDVRVAIGDAFCDEVTLINTLLTCSPPDTQPTSITGMKFPEVVVYQGNLNFTVGQLQYTGDDYILYIIIACVVLIIIVIIGAFVYQKAFPSDTTDRRIRDQIALYEIQVAQECKEAFAELQTAVTVLTRDLVAIPFREYHMYCIKTLFPDQPNHSVLKELSLAGTSQTNIEKGLVQFEQLVNNKQFLLTFIRTLEEQKGFTQKDKSNVASLMMVALQGKMDYCTTILKVLLADLIERHVQKGRERLLMRRNESVAEKMVSNWLTFLLYNFIKDTAGEPLFKLFIALKQQMEKGPVDAITGEARYGLSEVKVIRQQICFSVMMINAIGLGKDPQPVQVKVLDYDTIFQVKEKILDALCKTTPYSLRPPKDELDLEWRNGQEGRMLLQDDDNKTEGEWKRLRMLRDYSEIKDGATIALVPKQGFTMSAFSNSKCMSLPTANSPARSMTTPMLAADTDVNGTKLWHLVKPSDSEYHKSGDKDHKMLAEIYLPRLLTTKGVLQSYIDELFEMIFSVNHRSNTLPLCIKYLFDFLDDQARHHCIPNQEEVVHSWKSNSLPLRFWVNLIKNPDIIFDVYKSETVDACLSIIGQTLMDSCSVSDHPLTKDSPSSRLLYAKDIPRYKKWVASYYSDIKNYPAVSDQDMSAMLAEHSVRHQYDFHSKSALNELYFNYAQPYKRSIVEALEENEYNNLANKFVKLCDDLNNTL